MTTRRLFAVGLVLSGISLFSWVRADGSPEQSCCEPIVAVDPEDCTGGNHEEAVQRFRCNQSRQWRNMLVNKR